MTDPKITLSLDDVRHLFDLAVDTPLVCSGSFDTDDVELLRRIAVHLGVEPNGITPDEFAAQYPHKHKRRDVHAAMAYGETGEQAQARIARQRADVTCWVGTYGRRCGKTADDPIHQRETARAAEEASAA